MVLITVHAFASQLRITSRKMKERYNSFFIVKNVKKICGST